ncbi:MAG: GNAT family N-acetyltransferase [Xanthomonadales bacterium]|nr:GNAT family N-acetyltransferase [Xanthomonadales bacterium]
MANSEPGASPRLHVRAAELADIPQLVDLSARVYGADWGYSAEMLRGQITRFPEGQFAAIYGERVVGYCATFRIGESIALAPHTWAGITGGGFASRHVPDGEWLYGMEVCVDPDYRGLRIGRRLYSARKRLCQRLGLRGIVFGGRLPGLARRIGRYGSADAYVEAVVAGRQRDATLSFQLRNGFELVGLLDRYLPSDRESMGMAAHLVWRNPNRFEAPAAPLTSAGGAPRLLRIAAVQYQQRRIADFEAFAAQVEYFVDVAASYESDFVAFPELLALQLLSIANKPFEPAQAVLEIAGYAARLEALFSEIAVRHNINIIGGAHPVLDAAGELRIVAPVCLRDGSVHRQEKLHPTPAERAWWAIRGGARAEAIATDCGPIGVLVDYDAQFPEVARHLVDQGALILFVPFCSDERQGYLRLRYSAQARAIENQCYVVMSGNVGNLPGVNNFEMQYAQSCILTPCDFAFARDGIAADSTPNTEMVLLADLRLEDLARARNDGAVQNLKDRRHDLYQLRWTRRPE